MDKVLTKNEWLIMEALWSNSPMFLSQIMENMKNVADWKNSTYMTYLKRLTTAGFIKFDTVSGMRRYSPVFTREQCVDNETRNMKEKFSEQSTRLVLANLIREGGLKPGEYEELSKLIATMQNSEE